MAANVKAQGPVRRKGCQKKCQSQSVPPTFLVVGVASVPWTTWPSLPVGKVHFVKEFRADEDKCYELVQAYLLRWPEPVEGSCSGKKRGTWSREVHGEGQGFMTKILYLEHAHCSRQDVSG